MNFDEMIKESIQEWKEENLWGMYAEGYKEGVNASAQTVRLPRSKNPFTEINATLLIPEKHFKQFLLRRAAYGGVRPYIAHLLRKYRLHIACGIVPTYRNHTTKYQEKDQNLIRVAFRPNLDDWAELKLYRVSFGMSISAFLVYLLLADFVDFAEKVSHYLGVVGIPQSPNLDLWAKVYLSRKKSEYTIFFQYRPSPDG
jgi:hypothetical protein